MEFSVVVYSASIGLCRCTCAHVAITEFSIWSQFVYKVCLEGYSYIVVKCTVLKTLNVGLTFS